MGKDVKPSRGTASSLKSNRAFWCKQLVSIIHALLLGSILIIAIASPFQAQTASSAAPSGIKAPYLNPNLPIEQRVEDLVSRMTLEEKISQMQDQAAAIARLGVPRYDWWNEGLHGVAFSGYATNFPQVIGMAATWDTALINQMAEAISTEARAKYHQSMREKHYERFFGLTFWAPNVNIFRDPRWGRGQETYGEDPFLAGRMATAFVSGMQGNDPKHYRVISTPKHFAVHSGPEPLRHGFNANVSPHDLEDTYLPAFRAAIMEARAQSIMCAYNAVDGAPACANSALLQQHLRDAWRFEGYVVSDCLAVADISTGHKYAPDYAHASAAAIKAGTDLECGPGFPALTEAIKQDLISKTEIDAAVKRLFTARFRLGMFDPPDSYAYGRTPFSEVNSAEHRRLALRAARESIVLLKNDRGLLPLSPKTGTLAVIGPTAELVQSLQGNYNGTPLDPVSPIVGIERRFKQTKVLYAQGSSLAEGFTIPIAHTALRTPDGKEGLKGEYFNSHDLSGRPVAVRIDRTVNFNWDKAVPVPGLLRNNFAVRWSGTLIPPASGDYGIGARVAPCYACESSDQFRLYLDEKLIADTAQKGHLETVVHFENTQQHAIRLEYLHGTPAGGGGIDLTWQPPAAALVAEAVTAAKQADVVIAFVGLSPQLEGEEMPVELEGFRGGDRTDIRLPKVQRDLIKALEATGKPLVLVLAGGSALAISEEQRYARAILEAWYPGQEGGTAIAETLAGDNNPAGRLPLTFYSSTDQLPPFEDYSMTNRTYRYFTGRPLYGFGYGLSYSEFQYSNPKLSSQLVKAGDPVTVEVDVKNISNRAGDEVIQVYVTQPKAALTPLRTLGGFMRIHIKAGQTAHVRIPLDPRVLGQVGENGDRVIQPGTYSVAIGGAQPAEFPGAVTASFSIIGSRQLPR